MLALLRADSAYVGLTILNTELLSSRHSYNGSTRLRFAQVVSKQRMENHYSGAAFSQSLSASFQT